jgi:hypothetical protein
MGMRLIPSAENPVSLCSVISLDPPKSAAYEYGRQSQSGRSSLPYASGELPIVGDYVRNQWEQPGTVLEVCFAAGNSLPDQIRVRWDDGGTDLPLTPAVEFTLISRPSEIIADSTDHIPLGSVDGEREISQKEERITRLEIVPEVPPPVVVVACSTCKRCFYWPHGLVLPAYCPHCGAKHVTTPPGA